MKTTFTALGGLEANAFGINVGVKNALKQIEADPELVELIKKNSALASQNITVNLSGTGLINQAGQVISAPLSADLSEIEKIALQDEVDKKRFARGDKICSDKYGSRSKMDQTGSWCILHNGTIRPYPTDRTIDTIPDKPTPSVKLTNTQIVSSFHKSMAVVKKRVARSLSTIRNTRPTNRGVHRAMAELIKKDMALLEALKSQLVIYSAKEKSPLTAGQMHAIRVALRAI